jgi:hypothetical protein
MNKIIKPIALVLVLLMLLTLLPLSAFAEETAETTDITRTQNDLLEQAQNIISENAASSADDAAQNDASSQSVSEEKKSEDQSAQVVARHEVGDTVVANRDKEIEKEENMQDYVFNTDPNPSSDELWDLKMLYRKFSGTSFRPTLTDPINLEDNQFMQTLATIASSEVNCFEDAYGEMCYIAPTNDWEVRNPFKYSEWFYRNEIEELGADFYYPDQINNDFIFVMWCAEQLGYVSHGYFPEANTAQYLMESLIDFGNKYFQLNDPNLMPQPSDLMFEPGIIDDYIVSIVTDVKDDVMTYVTCDVNRDVVQYTVSISEMPRTTQFIRLSEIKNKNLLFAANFIEKQLNVNSSVAAGILANMRYESGFSPVALGDAGTSFGLCQWHNERWDALIDFCSENGYDWHTTNGQMHFLIHEITTYEKYIDLVAMMNACEDSATGAYQSAYFFCIKYEKPQDMEIKADVRGMYSFETIYPMLFSPQKMEQLLILEETREERQAAAEAAEAQRQADMEAAEAQRIADEEAQKLAEEEAAKAAEEQKRAAEESVMEMATMLKAQFTSEQKAKNEITEKQQEHKEEQAAETAETVKADSDSFLNNTTEEEAAETAEPET